ncbi:MAG: hypothetical protein A2X64_07655 [Ignavibacteria bacterium GWF2_33_9]|nr:MAG: hypothetical protein A2X64_07655 [Ignavibacteria bacterium GWF2_33_9]
MYNRLNRIDGLRAIAILGVIAIHCGLIKNNPYNSIFVEHLIHHGKLGVQLFFLISGFILCYVADNSHFTKTTFFLKRFFRLAPIYYLILLICFLIGFNENLGNEYRIRPLNLDNLAIHLTFLHGLFPSYLRSIFSVCWSLTPEVIFYFIFPFLYKLDSKKLLVLFIISAILSKHSLFISNLLFDKDPISIETWARCSPVGNMFLFIFGILVYKNEKFFKNIKIQIFSFLCLIIFLIPSLNNSNFFITKILNYLFFDLYFSLILISFPFLIYNSSKILSLLLDNRIISFLGKISYSAFFIHFAIIQTFIFYNIKFNYSIGLITVLSLTVIISYLTYNFIEKPGIKLGNYLIKNYNNKIINTEINQKS